MLNNTGGGAQGSPFGYVYDSELTIGGKPIYIVEKHNHAFYYWAKIRAELGATPLLLTLDFHTDTDAGFRKANALQALVQLGTGHESMGDAWAAEAIARV